MGVQQWSLETRGRSPPVVRSDDGVDLGGDRGRVAAVSLLQEPRELATDDLLTEREPGHVVALVVHACERPERRDRAVEVLCLGELGLIEIEQHGKIQRRR